MDRPRHPVVADETGRTKSMPGGMTQFEVSLLAEDMEGPVIFLGLGPEPDRLAEWFHLPSDEQMFFLESQDFVDQMGDGWVSRIPENFERIAPQRFTCELAGSAHVFRYLPVQRAFPSFYNPLTARLALSDCPPGKVADAVWLPGSNADLLAPELEAGFAEAGLAPERMDPEPLVRSPGTTLPPMLQTLTPRLFFSVNFRGLDPFGLGYRLLREAGCRVAVWLVDNPAHLLTGIKSDYWRGAELFVTDASFITPLRQAGARRVHHLPLATDPEIMAGGELPEHGADLAGHPVFVGRSSFPDRDRYFAGLAPDPALITEAEAMLDRGERPDYHWWRQRLGGPDLWPGNAVRTVGCGAEAMGRAWKVRCLNELGRGAERPVIFGDEQWHALCPGADLRPFVDYYAQLPAVYRAAGCVLNITGMQLPAGLTQRHFDVWAAGGFLITDRHHGLDIFPPELVHEIAFDRAADLPDLVHRFREQSTERKQLASAWRAEILANHTYGHRAREVLAALDLG